MAYEIEGRLLEVCTCNTLCPCWVGEDPDGGTCEGTMAWAVDKGQIEGTDVSGLVVGTTVHIPGNILRPKTWTAAFFVDERASPEQEAALLKVFTGQLGGAIADMAGLIGEVVSVERVPFTFDVEGGRGRFTMGAAVEAELAPFQGALGKPTVLSETVFSTIPGSPAYVGKASNYRRDGAKYGLKDVAIRDHNAVQGHFRFAA